MDSEPSSQNPTDMTAFVQNLLGQMIDELEQSINNLKAEMGTEMPAKKPDEPKPADSA
ncbi:hypothetical protein SORBI_3002G186966 [Sorghum bicolor]|uniref:Heat shock factor binding protein n=1 Tax=Sorghum bicolor TaxID=4558 RepID=A0A1W0W4T9_SORBI|nr:hypothetical protein SORBI_3002G186966 [Sorghum bicolor]